MLAKMNLPFDAIMLVKLGEMKCAFLTLLSGYEHFFANRSGWKRSGVSMFIKFFLICLSVDNFTVCTDD